MFLKNQEILIATVNEWSYQAKEKNLEGLLSRMNDMHDLYTTEKEVIRGEDGLLQKKTVGATDANLVNVIMRTLVTSQFTDTESLKEIRVYDKIEKNIVYLRCVFRTIALYNQFTRDKNADALNKGKIDIGEKLISDFVQLKGHENLDDFIIDFVENYIKSRSGKPSLHEALRGRLSPLLDKITGDVDLQEHWPMISLWKDGFMNTESKRLSVVKFLQGRQEHFPLLKKTIEHEMSVISPLAELITLDESRYYGDKRAFCVKIQNIVDWIKYTETNPLKVTEDGNVVYPQALKDGLPCPVMEQNNCDEFDDDSSSSSSSDDDDGSDDESSSIELSV